MDLTLILVTLLSLTLAAVMTMLAWRLAREERRRSDARVAALAVDMRAAERDLPLHHVAPVVTSRDLFEAPAARPASSSRIAAAMVGTAGLVACVVVVWYLAAHLSAVKPAADAARRGGSGAAQATQAQTQTAATTHAPADAAPLELTALTHERDNDRLTVRGIVRNPAGSPGLRGLAAVVFLFDRDGNFVTSGRGAIDVLSPAAESSFAVTIPNVGEVGRYRVSFRTDDTIVPHVDRRDRPVAEVKPR
jgi:hypothetical protein